MVNDYFTKATESLFQISTAWHEASHVICYLYYYRYVFKATLKQSKNYRGGYTLFQELDLSNVSDKNLKKKLLKQDIQCLYAGMIGESIFYKEICGSHKFPIYMRIGSSSDITTASQIIYNNNLSLPGKQSLALKRKMKSKAKKIVLRYWYDIQLIAHELFLRKEISFQDIFLILTTKSKNKKNWIQKLKTVKYLQEQEETDFSKFKLIK